jgi:hypothetical protein
VPIAVEHDERRRWIIAIASGVLTLADVITLIRTARASVEYRMWPMLVDAQTATTDMTEADVERAAEAIQRAARAEGPRAHVALVAHDDIVYAPCCSTRCAARTSACETSASFASARMPNAGWRSCRARAISVEGSGYRAGHEPLAGRHPSTSMNA